MPIKLSLIIIVLILIALLSNCPVTLAGELSDRLEQYPNWHHKPPISKTQEDLIYPDSMAGTWQVTSILVNQIAPLAPEIITPGFEQNCRYLQQPIQFKVKFQAKPLKSSKKSAQFLAKKTKSPIIANRSFNGFNIAQAYLGDKAVLAVKSDPQNANRQITFLENNNQLISTVIGRKQENSAKQLITTELAQQVFRGNGRIYVNQVETTTAYYLVADHQITANQVTAIYLSSQDPNYFKALNRPVALYQYRLELLKIDNNK